MITELVQGSEGAGCETLALPLSLALTSYTVLCYGLYTSRASGHLPSQYTVT